MPEIICQVNPTKLKVTLFAMIFLLFPPPLRSQTVPLNDLSFFRDAGKSWSIAGQVTADLREPGTLNTSGGKGILVNRTSKKDHGTDLYSLSEYGDIDLELDYLMAAGSNSGIYLQGRYEIQLHDTWGSLRFTSGNNGGIYERWNNNAPEGRKGYEGYPPRQNVSRAPGLWQHLKISFKAPVFDARGQKVESAKMLLVELNGVVIHKNVELSGPTRGAISPEERAMGPLRFQGDHGSVAFRNINITSYPEGRPAETVSQRRGALYPISVNRHSRPVFRSFMDLPEDIRVVHAISVASPYNVHYTYDADTGMILQVWRGDFLDATPMWYSRGDGSSRPVGAVTGFGKPSVALARLSSPQDPWIKDTTGTGFRPKGYTLNENNEPVFKYMTYGTLVSDKTMALDNGKGVRREIAIDKSLPDMYVRLAEGATIEEVSKGLYLIDHNSYYLQLENVGELKPRVRESNGRKELVLPLRSKVTYSILF